MRSAREKRKRVLRTTPKHTLATAHAQVPYRIRPLLSRDQEGFSAFILTEVLHLLALPDARIDSDNILYK